MFGEFRVFDQSENVLLSQLQMTNSKEVEPARPKLSEPMARLYDQVEVLITTGRARSCSEALAIIGATDPATIDAAAAVKSALESPTPVDTAERRYRAAIEQAKRDKCLSFESAQQYVNKAFPQLREDFVSEHNQRHAVHGPVGAKVGTATRDYWAKVDEIQKAKQLSKPESMRYVNAHHTDLREAMVKEINR